MDRLLVDQRSTRTATLFSLLFIFLNLTGETLQFPGGFQEKRFNVEAVPSKNVRHIITVNIPTYRFFEVCKYKV